MECPLDCFNTLLSISDFISHLNICPNVNKLINGEYILCKYDSYHIIKSCDEEDHLNSCEYKDIDMEGNDILKCIFRSDISKLIDSHSSQVKKWDMVNYNKEYLDLLYNSHQNFRDETKDFLSKIFV